MLSLNFSSFEIAFWANLGYFLVHKFLKMADDIKHVKVIICAVPSVAGNYKLASTCVNACWDKSKIHVIVVTRHEGFA